MKTLKTHRCFGGEVRFFAHDSAETKTEMKFSSFKPDGPIAGCLIWLSGLTCTDENFMAKAGAFRALRETRLMVVCPDTSPRGLHLPGEHESSDFGSGAGFYLDATTPGYRDHYRMGSYIEKELFGLVRDQFGVGDRISLFGHSMGGHGALTIGLRCANQFRSVSAFAPIVHPVEVPWGQKAFRGYLGDDSAAWKKYDACELLNSGLRRDDTLLVDQGASDPFLKEQLRADDLRAACERAGQKLNLRIQEGYDHSYYFIASFIDDHIRFHAERLR